MATETITYNEKAQGWTSFHSWKPDWMAKLNDRLFSIKDGQLWMHNDEDNPVMNNFYGTQYNSKIVTVINEANSEDKIFKTFVIEGNKPWDVAIETNLTQSTIAKEEFNTRESRHFAYIRQNETVTDLHGNSVQGLGDIVSHSGLNVNFANSPQLVNLGDTLCQLNGTTEEVIGTITAITGGSITVNAITTAAVNGRFAYAKKNARVEGGDIRGYYGLITMEDDSTDYTELFAISSAIVRSGVNIQNPR